jgi:Dolichyl-phosphate-mannose-protein mannosyltransferase
VIKTVTSILVAVGLGLAFVSAFWPVQRRLMRDLQLIITLSAGLGVGISSLFFFLWLVAFGRAGSGFIGCEVGLLLTFSALAVLRRRKRYSNSVPVVASHAAHQSRLFEWITGTTSLIALVAAGMAFKRFIHSDLHGGWDAWGIWNLRAKFLFLGGLHWSDAFSAQGSLFHRDYPLLIPASVARGWLYAGSDLSLAPILIAILFTGATAGLLFSSLSSLRSKTCGFLAATALLATPFFVVLGAAQYADVPVGFFYLATFVLFCLYEESQEGSNGLLVLTGASAGLAAWTKNEGILFLICLLLAHLTLSLRRHRSRPWMQLLLPIVAGLAPMLLVLVYFKANFSARNDLFSSVPMMLKMLGRISRWRIVVKAFADQLLHFGGWTISLTPFIALYAAVARGERKQAGIGPGLCLRVVGLMLIGHFFVYVTAPVPLEWLLETSLNRVLMQLWPSVLFGIFLLTNPPGQADS